MDRKRRIAWLVGWLAIAFGVVLPILAWLSGGWLDWALKLSLSAGVVWLVLILWVRVEWSRKRRRDARLS